MDDGCAVLRVSTYESSEPCSAAVVRMDSAAAW